MSKGRRKRHARVCKANHERRRRHLSFMLGRPIDDAEINEIARWCDEQRRRVFASLGVRPLDVLAPTRPDVYEFRNWGQWS